jgi:hypothetical protein
MASFNQWTVMALFILGFWSIFCIEAAILSRDTQQPCIANGKLKSLTRNQNDADFIPLANQGISSIDMLYI